jgi:rare lipoprotein A
MRITSILAVALILVACSLNWTSTDLQRGAGTAAGRDARPLFEQRGEASWFGDAIEGRKGVSGERIDPDQRIAAHMTLPMGSLVRVTRLDNSRSVEVEVVDRGPTAPGRVIDLSRRAAEELGMTKRGTAQVMVEAYASDQRDEPVRRALAALAGR